MIKTIQNYRHIFIISIILISVASCSKSTFRGSIDYDVSYPGSRIDYATQEALPSKMNVSANDNLVKKEMIGGELIQTQISDSETETLDILLEIMGQKYHIQKTKEEVLAALKELPEPKFEYTAETKEILGYTCHKVEAVSYDEYGEEIVSVIYFTKDVPGFPFNFDLPYREIPGLMLVYELKVGDINMRFEAKEIKERRRGTGKRSFKIPSGYNKTTYEELRKKL